MSKKKEFSNNRWLSQLYKTAKRRKSQNKSRVSHYGNRPYWDKGIFNIK